MSVHLASMHALNMKDLDDPSGGQEIPQTTQSHHFSTTDSGLLQPRPYP